MLRLVKYNIASPHFACRAPISQWCQCLLRYGCYQHQWHFSSQENLSEDTEKVTQKQILQLMPRSILFLHMEMRFHVPTVVHCYYRYIFMTRYLTFLWCYNAAVVNYSSGYICQPLILSIKPCTFQSSVNYFESLVIFCIELYCTHIL